MSMQLLDVKLGVWVGLPMHQGDPWRPVGSHCELWPEVAVQHTQALPGGSVAARQARARLGQPLPRRCQLRRVLQLEQAPAGTQH